MFDRGTSRINSGPFINIALFVGTLYIHVLKRDEEKEERKKQANQTNNEAKHACTKYI